MAVDKEELIDEYEAKTVQSRKAFMSAAAHLPGGLTRTSLVRRPHPLFAKEAHGKELVDIDGNRYLDFVMNLGPNLLGHAHPAIVEAVVEQAHKGTGFGVPSPLEDEVAALITQTCPTAEKVRFALAGTDANAFLTRMARAHTGRPKIVKFLGFYHGSAEDLMLSNRPTKQPFEGEDFASLPSTEGLMQGTTHDVLAVQYNDLDALEQCIGRYRGQVAGIILDPTGNNCGLIQPEPGFLQGVAELARKSDILLLFDEVVSGYRYGLGGAQAAFGVRPDLTSFGKALGGGLPLSAIVGRKEVMALLNVEPNGHSRVSQSGTFFGNPISLAAGRALLQFVTSKPSVYDHLNGLGERFRRGIAAIARKHGAPLLASGSHSMVQLHFGLTSLVDYRDFARRDAVFREQFYLYAALQGIFVPSPTGSFFMCTEHTDADVDRLLGVLDEFTGKYVAR